MKKLVLVLAIVFAFGVTYALNIEASSPKASTEQTSTADEKEKKEAKTEKKEACSEKKSKECCSKKKACSDKK